MGKDERGECGERDERGERGEDAKNATFTTYPRESKGLVNVVNVVRKFFASSRMSFANLYLGIVLLRTRNYFMGYPEKSSGINFGISPQAVAIASGISRSTSQNVGITVFLTSFFRAEADSTLDFFALAYRLEAVAERPKSA